MDSAKLTMSVQTRFDAPHCEAELKRHLPIIFEQMCEQHLDIQILMYTLCGYDSFKSRSLFWFFFSFGFLMRYKVIDNKSPLHWLLVLPKLILARTIASYTVRRADKSVRLSGSLFSTEKGNENRIEDNLLFLAQNIKSTVH